MQFSIDSGIAAILGTSITLMASIIMMRIQKKAEYKKELMRMAHEMAKDEVDKLIDLRTKAITLLPIEVFYRYHFRMLQLMSMNKKVSKTQYLKLIAEKEEFETMVASIKEPTKI